VTQIALTVGYQSPSHFTVRFRRRFGFPPSAIRESGRRA
jgi:AraC-like DNA-binding protein